MKRLLVLGLLLLIKQSAVGQLVALHVNAPNGDAVEVSSDLSLMADSANPTNAAGIAFNDGDGFGAVTGGGDLSVESTASKTEGGPEYLAGIAAEGVDISMYDGDIEVNLDRSLFKTNATGGVEADASVDAVGIDAHVIGNVDEKITVTATGGNATSESGSAYADADVTGIDGDVAGDVSGEIELTATGGKATSTDGYAYAGADAYGVDEVFGEMSGTIKATATGGNADGYDGAYADADAYALYYGTYGDMSGTLEATAIGGTAKSSAGQARAEADAYGFDDDVYGDVTGTVKATATGGSADGYTDAYADAYASALYYDVYGDVSGTAEATATGGTAKSTDGTAYAQGYVDGSDDYIYGDVSGTVKATATGGSAEGVSASAYASAYGLYEVYGEISGVVEVTAIGGTAKSTTGSANAYARAYGLDDYVYGGVSGTVEATATGGTATSSDGSASAYANADGADDYLYGEVSGTVKATATGGDAEGLSSASAYANASALDYEVYGDASGTVEATATGGTAKSSGGSASAYANAYGVDDYLYGNMSGTVKATATGGDAEGSSTADADAYASALYEVYGDISGTVEATATGGTATSTNGSAYARADAYGTDDYVYGSVSGTIKAMATGGSAEATSTAYADAEAYGVDGDVYGVLDGDVEATATAGQATSSAGNAYAGADAEGIYGDVYGSINGTVSAKAMAGSANAELSAYADADAYGIDGDVEGKVFGTVEAIATAGTATSASGFASADASAYAISGSVLGLDDGMISATATAGKATGATSASADAYAQVIDGSTVAFADLSTDIIATAIAGVVTTGGVSRSGYAEAVAIEASDVLYVSASDVKIHAVAKAADGYELPDDNSESYSLIGGSGDDAVILDNVSLIGSVDLGSGSNRFVVLGDVRLEGGLMASGGGINQIELESGMLRFAGGPVELTGLYEDELVVGKSAGLGFELQEDPASADNTMLDIDGKLVVKDGAGIGAYAADGQMASEIIGNTYTNITTTDGVDGKFVESTKSMFTVDVATDGTNVMVTATGMRPLDEGGTPGGVSAMQVVSSSTIALFDDLSSHAGGMRSMMRVPAAKQQEAKEQAPEGAAGPDMDERRRLESGEWLTYVRQINYFGSQDSDGGFAGYDWNSHGFMVGGEKLVKDDMIVGGAAGGMWGDLDADKGAGGAGSDMFMASVYGNWFSETWYADFGLAYGHAWNDSTRYGYDDQRYTGDFDSNILGAWLEGGYTFLKDEYEIEPYGRVAYVLGMHGSYTDGGEGTQPLSVDSHTAHNLPIELGCRGARNWMLDSGGYLRLVLRAGLRIELLDNSMDPDGKLIGADVPLQSPESDAAALVLGVKGDWAISDRFIFSLEYEPVISGNWYYQNIAGELSYKF